MKLFFDHTQRSFVTDEGIVTPEAVLLNVDMWVDLRITKTCPQGVIVGFLEGLDSPETVKILTTSVRTAPTRTGWLIGCPTRTVTWAGKVIVSGSNCWIEDPKETE